MKKALLYQKLDKQKVQCQACAHGCIILKDDVGICRVRKNEAGDLFSLVYGKVIAQHVDPIEKKPLYEFLPKSLAYSIATVGCNFKCLHCQNAEIAHVQDPSEWLPGVVVPVEEIIHQAIETGCSSIAYTYTEPTVFLEFALAVMKAAKKKSLKNVWVSNGYFSEKTWNLILPYLDAINIDLKFFKESSYQRVCSAKLAPVLENIKRVADSDVHLELTTLIIPSINDSDKELREMVDFVKKLGKDIPWHLSTFHPSHKMLDIPPTPYETLKRAENIAVMAGLKKVYLGNV